MGDIRMTRRRFLGIGAAGAGALALPATALAQTFAQPGIAEDGTLVEGFVKVSGDTFGYVGGEMQTGAAKVRGKWYHFDDPSGAMTFGKVEVENRASRSEYWLSDEDSGELLPPGQNVTGEFDEGKQRYYVDPDTRHTPAEGVHVIEDCPVRSGGTDDLWDPSHVYVAAEGYLWRNVRAGKGGDDSGNAGYAYFSDNDGALLKDGWTVTGEFTDGDLERYWVDSTAHGIPLGYSEGDWPHYTLDAGYVARGRVDTDAGMAIADDDGRLLLSATGFIVTDELDGELQRYYVDPETRLCRTGEFTVGGKAYVGRHDTGYCVRGTYFQDGYLYTCDNDGVLIGKTEENWWMAGGYSGDVHNAAALAKLAVRVAVTCEPADRLTAPGGDIWATCDDTRAQEYFKVCEKSTKRYDWTMGGSNSHHENVAYASCTQAVAMIARATVDPDMWMGGPADTREYLASSPRWDEAGRFYGDANGTSWLEPGDILCDVGDDHTALYVSNELVRMKYPDSTANVYEAHSGLASYPELATGSMGSYDYVVYRFNGTMGADLAYFDPWKLLAGDTDWDNQ